MINVGINNLYGFSYAHKNIIGIFFLSRTIFIFKMIYPQNKSPLSLFNTIS